MPNENESSALAAKGGEVRKSSGAQAHDRFTSMMIETLKRIKASDWKQGWTNGKGAFLGMPQNIAGRTYSGTNSFFLQMDTAMNGYSAPVYATFLQCMKENLRIKKGAEAMPVIYWDLNVKDANGHRMSVADYKSLTPAQQKKCDVHPFMRAFKVFNVMAQTNLRDVNQEKYDALMSRFQGPQLRDKEGMYVCPALDRMFERQEWICRVQTSKLVDGAFYSPSRDLVVVPMKEQFNIGKNAEEIYKDGMEYYSSALHEMTHSTGTANRLNREKGAKFGDAKYAKEEMVAELTAAMVGNALGFDKRILSNNACYVQGWINAMRQEPKFIISVMADVNKAARMILEKVDEQKIALGERPILSTNIAKLQEKGVMVEKMSSTRKSAPEISLNAKFDDAKIYKQADGKYVVSATFDGHDLGKKPISKVDGVRYELIPPGAVKDQILQDTASRKFSGDIEAIREINKNLPKDLSVHASVSKDGKGEYVVQATVGDHKLAPKAIDPKEAYKYMRMPAGWEKMAVLSNFVKDAYGDELKAMPDERKQSAGQSASISKGQTSPYEQYKLPDNAQVSEISLRKDASGDWLISAAVNVRGRTDEHKVSIEDVKALRQTKTATKEQLAAKYLSSDIENLTNSKKVEQSRTMKR